MLLDERLVRELVEHLRRVHEQQRVSLFPTQVDQHRRQVAASGSNVEHDLILAEERRQLGDNVAPNSGFPAFAIRVWKSNLLVAAERAINRHPTKVLERQVLKALVVVQASGPLVIADSFRGAAQSGGSGA